MKQLYLISAIFFFFSATVSAQEGWTTQTSPSASILSGIYAIDSLNVWAVGQNGLIVHTTDGGVSWDSVPSGTSRRLTTVEFIDAETGFVGGEEDESSPPFTDYLVQRTTDGGATWEFQELIGGDQLTITDIDFVPGPPGESIRGYSIAGLANTWRTDHMGDPWEHTSGNCGEGNFNSCCFVDSVTGWYVGTPAMGNEYTIMHTTDGGDTFVEQTDPVGIKLNGVCFATPLKGVAVGNSGTAIYTSDGGETWEQSMDEDLGYNTWFSVYLTESGKAWTVGNKGLILYSSDWGHTWEPQESGVTQPLWEVYFVNDHEGWIVGGLTSGLILHTKNGGGANTTGVGNVGEGQAISFKLGQNYPNPFRTSTQISYTLIRSGHVSLKIYDLSGREIQTLVNEVKNAGEHTVQWDADSFGNGLYFYKLKVNDEPSELKKMVLAR